MIFLRIPRPYLLLLALCTVFASRILWWDLRTISRGFFSPSVVRVIFTAYALSLIPFMIFYFLKIGKRALYYRPIVFYILINYYGLMLAFINQNNLLYTFQDIFKLFWLPTGFLAYTFAKKYLDKDDFLLRFAVIMLVMEIFRLIVHAQYGKIRYGMIYDMIPFIVFTYYTFPGHKLINKQYAMLSLFSIILIIIGQKRSLAFCIALSSIVIISLRWRYVPFYIILILLFVNLPIAWYSLSDLGNFIDENLKRLTLIPTKTEDIQEHRLFEEVYIVKEVMAESNLFDQIFGKGHGATFTYHHVIRGELVVHSVHFTPIAMVFRYGIVGVIFYLYLFGLFLYYFFRVFRTKQSKRQSYAIIAVIYIGISFVGAITHYGFVDDILVGVMFGILNEEYKHKIRINRYITKANTIRYGNRPHYPNR